MMCTDVRSLGLGLALVVALGMTHALADPNGKARPFKGDAQSLVTGELGDGAGPRVRRERDEPGEVHQD